MRTIIEYMQLSHIYCYKKIPLKIVVRVKVAFKATVDSKTEKVTSGLLVDCYFESTVVYCTFLTK